MTLRQQQSLFAVLVARLIQHAIDLGYEVTLGEALRSPEEAIRLAKLKKGIVNSVHCVKLAIDLNLFKGGKYLTSSEAHLPLGRWWTHQHNLCRWGGDFMDDKGRPKPDGNHYSLEYKGRK